ncbi:MAG: bifunctional adenosylcobinamide kinase/adenosylcobinamide-phosphate guanylyltransferase [Candidatus Ornithomonoglobus sp.]
MFEFIIGGSGSGKSEYAENRARELCAEGEPLLYIATMKRGSEAAEERIQRHRRQREGKGFLTIERPSDLLSLQVPENSTVLLECMSNILANEMFDAGGYYVKRIILGIERLRFSCKNFVLVSDDVFSDGIEYGGETEKYKSALAELNKVYAEKADRVTEVTASIPNIIK